MAKYRVYHITTYTLTEYVEVEAETAYAAEELSKTMTTGWEKVEDVVSNNVQTSLLSFD